MRFEWGQNKEDKDIQKQGLDFSYAGPVFLDPLRILVFDRHEDGEDRWHMFGMIGDRLMLVVHAYPDEEDEGFVRVIGIRKATSGERRCYETENSDRS